MSLKAFVSQYTNHFELSQHPGEGGCKVHRGYVHELTGLPIPANFTEQVKYQEGGRRVWISCLNLSVIHYCEGNIAVTEHQSFLSLKQEIFRMDSLYLN